MVSCVLGGPREAGREGCLGVNGRGQCLRLGQ